MLRLALDSYDDVGPHGRHKCSIDNPPGMSFVEFQDLLPDKKLPKDLVQRSPQLTLIALAFMHERSVFHTGECVTHAQEAQAEMLRYFTKQHTPRD